VTQHSEWQKNFAHFTQEQLALLHAEQSAAASAVNQ